ncbi:hypothetical protein BURPS1106B_1870 [Burkholderia pseudomallei 1106b]|uniref:Uncharacterized protein n=1 Tax=Burkholderia pseudomallei (strain 1106a) TaxID=357348 RepID=A3P1F2_BURP0|nr:hypothetical protein BURPS1106A_A0119 [Burkholderia pseudomallei 1106a]EES21966.1 hypothetical protein BURPS1106B_1870 [Burkholderia pseudomallei 1106b]
MRNSKYPGHRFTSGIAKQISISFDRHAPYSRSHDFLLKQFRNDQAHHSDSNSPAT